MRVELLQGNEACAEGALAAGADFFAGYPITPATEIAEVMARRLPERGGVFLQMEDEMACMAAVIGASLAGARAFTATSGPGFTLVQENLGFAIMAEVPCVVICVQRGGPSTGLPTLPAQGDVMQARWGTHGDHPAIAIAPSTVTEAFYFTAKAFDLAERFRMPVVVLSDATIGHLREKAVLPEAGEVRIRPRRKPAVPADLYVAYRPLEDGVPPMANFGEGYRHYISGTYHEETGKPNMANTEVASKLLERFHAKVDLGPDEFPPPEPYLLDDAEVGVISFGSAARSAREAVRMARGKGIKAGVLRLTTVWPFPDRAVARVAEQVKALVVAEMNMGQVLGEVIRAVSPVRRTGVLGASDEAVPGGDRLPVAHARQLGGAILSPQKILSAIEEVAARG